MKGQRICRVRPWYLGWEGTVSSMSITSKEEGASIAKDGKKLSREEARNVDDSRESLPRSDTISCRMGLHRHHL